jgi:hypothetical protein
MFLGDDDDCYAILLWSLLLRPCQVERLVCGNPNLDFEALERNSKYEGGFSVATPAVQWLWQVRGQAGARQYSGSGRCGASRARQYSGSGRCGARQGQAVQWLWQVRGQAGARQYSGSGRCGASRARQYSGSGRCGARQGQAVQWLWQVRGQAGARQYNGFGRCGVQQGQAVQWLWQVRGQAGARQCSGSGRCGGQQGPWTMWLAKAAHSARVWRAAAASSVVRALLRCVAPVAVQSTGPALLLTLECFAPCCFWFFCPDCEA